MTFEIILFLIISSALAHIDVDDQDKDSSNSVADYFQQLLQPRMKRGASGALHIVTNHAQPIHADVKSEVTNDNTERTITEQPCPNGSGPAHIEPGVGFKVTPPEGAVMTFEQNSLRRSFTPPSTILLIRSLSRVITLVVLFLSAVFEFYPTFYSLVSNIASFMYTK